LGWILAAVGAGCYAIRLNRSGGWGILSLIVSPVPVFLLLFGLGPHVDDEEEYRIACPFCAESIRSEAVICPHCRSELTRSHTERSRPQ